MAAFHLTLSTIALDGGWSGQVVTSISGPAAGVLSERRLPDADSWKRFLRRFLGDGVELPGVELLKYSSTGEVRRVRLEDGSLRLELIAKQSRPQGLRRWRLLGGRSSRERRNFARAAKLLHAAIRTAVPLAVIERRRPDRSSWLFTEYLEGLTELGHLATAEAPRWPPNERRRRKDRWIGLIADLLHKLTSAGFTHRDFKASNLMAQGEAGLILVDLDGLRPAWGSPRRKQLRPVIRLAADLQECPSVTRSDLLRLLRGLSARAGRPSDDGRRSFRVIARKAESYVRREKLS